MTAIRHRMRQSLLASLMLARGVPLLLAGDEANNGQDGNNNAYCQDNEIGWVNWSGLGTDCEDLTGFIGRLAELRNRFVQLRARTWLAGSNADGISRENNAVTGEQVGGAAVRMSADEKRLQYAAATQIK